MNFGPEIVVTVSSSSVPVKFRAEDSPTWGTILQQLSIEHGPGVLKDGQGFNKLLNAASLDQAVPLGTYEYITQHAPGGRQVVINIPESLADKIGDKHLRKAAATDLDAPKPAAWGDPQQAVDGSGVTLKWEVAEGCCMRVQWPNSRHIKHGQF